MNQTSFAVRSEKTLSDLLDMMSEHDELADFDMDMIDGVLTVECDDGSKIILNRQEPLEQIWLASPEGPAHFSYDETTDEWKNSRTEETLMATLNRILSSKAGGNINL